MSKQNILVDFPCLFDTDYGSLLYLMYKCKHSPYFIDGYRQWSEYFVQCKLATRLSINPLSCILKDEYLNNTESLYSELCDKQYQDILLLAKQTDILKLLNHMISYRDYSVTVLCSNEMEVSHLHLYCKWDTSFATNDNSYSCFFFHNLDKRISELKEFKSKTIYIYYHKPNFINFKDKIPNISIAPYILMNDFRSISPYIDLIIPHEMIINDMEVPKNGEIINAK